MGDKVTLNLDTAQSEALQEMERDGSADNISEAGRTALNSGLSELGYLNGRKERDVGWVLGTLGFVSAVLAMAWLGVTIWLPVEFRTGAMLFLSVSVLAFALDRMVRGPAVVATVERWLGRGGQA